MDPSGAMASGGMTTSGRRRCPVLTHRFVRPSRGRIPDRSSADGWLRRSAARSGPARGPSATRRPRRRQLRRPPSTGFYLMAWQTQASRAGDVRLAAVATIADGQYIDGRVAIPMIYPGPIYIDPSARSINAAGIAAIVARLTPTAARRQDGLSAGSAPVRSWPTSRSPSTAPLAT